MRALERSDYHFLYMILFLDISSLGAFHLNKPTGGIA